MINSKVFYQNLVISDEQLEKLAELIAEKLKKEEL